MLAVDKIHMLAESKLNSIEKIISRALSDMEISHEELIINWDEKDKYERMKYKTMDEIKMIHSIYSLFNWKGFYLMKLMMNMF